MTEQQQLPDTPGEYWFSGKVIIPYSATPGNNVTVHLAQPRRILMVQSPHCGLVPADPQTFECYALYAFIGIWESQQRTVTTRIPRELTEWMNTP